MKSQAIPSLCYQEENGELRCGFSVNISKTQTGRYKKQLRLLHGEQVSYDIVTSDEKIPKIYAIPLTRTENVYDDCLTTSVSNFIESEDSYKQIKEQSKNQVKEQLEPRINQFKELCKKFNQDLDINIGDPRLLDEKIFVVENDKEHGRKIGSGYKSIANILLANFNEKYSIILIDEIENHIHPALLRVLLRDLRKTKDAQIIVTSHSSVVINECDFTELIDVPNQQLRNLDDNIKNRLQTFLHPGRCEIFFADNIILVEGYTEELLLTNFLNERDNQNWTIVNVANVMFEPYIKLAITLGDKRIIVISDDDRKASNGPSSRYEKLQKLCAENEITLLNTENTLESDLAKNGLLETGSQFLKDLPGTEYKIAKNSHAKMLIAWELIDKKVDLSNWHVMKDLKNAIGNS